MINILRCREILVEQFKDFPKTAWALRQTSRQLVAMKLRHGYLTTVEMTIAGSENSWSGKLQSLFQIQTWIVAPPHWNSRVLKPWTNWAQGFYQKTSLTNSVYI